MAARRDAEGRLRDHPCAIRRRARLLAALPAPPEDEADLRRAHDRPPVRARISWRQADDLPRPPEGRASGRCGRRDRGRESQRRRHRARAAARLASDRGAALLAPFGRAAREQEPRRMVAQSPTTRPLHQIRLERRAAARAARRAFYDSHVVDDEELARGLADGTLAIDTRLRDALRALRGPSGSFDVLPAARQPARIPGARRRGGGSVRGGGVRRSSRSTASCVPSTCRCQSVGSSTRATGFAEARRSGERPQPRRRLARR